MTRRQPSAFPALALGIVAFIACSTSLAAPPQAPSPQPPPSAEPPPFFIVDEFDRLASPRGRDVLSTLQPVVKRFDFDDSLAGANALPPDFFRYVAPSRGYPPFGEMRVVEGAGYAANANANAAASGALQFDLLGGSMSARIGAAVIPVLPFADYIVGCRVRTEGLQHAQARLVAWLCDSSGRMIAASRVESRPADADGRWDTLALEVHGDFADAADLIFELQLAQTRRPQEQALVDPDPQMQDVQGRAWFDDVVVSHMPRVQLQMKQSQHLVVQGEPVSFEVQVKELASERLTARLRVLDMDGVVRSDRSFVAPRGRDASEVEITLDRCGWYRAVLDVASDQGIARRRWLDLLVLPATTRAGAGAGSFGVTLRDAMSADAADIALRLGCGMVVAPAWAENMTLAELPRIAAARRTTIERLLRSDIDVAFALTSVPDELAKASGPSGRTALEALGGDPQTWRPYLDDLLMHFGLSIDRWIVGDERDVHSQPDQMAARIEAATQALAAFVPGPTVHLAWPIEQQPLADSNHAAVALQAPTTIQPAALGDYLAPWLESGRPSTIVNLELLSPEHYSPRQRVIDATLRGLHAWRAGSPATLIAQPWSVPAEGAAAPDVVAAVWHGLNHQLAGRRFISELPLGPDVHVWAVAGRDADDAAIIAWCDQSSSSASAATHIDLQLADHALEAQDVFGNRWTSEPNDGLHRVALAEMPVFIQGVSLELVLFRSGVSIEPSFIPAASKVHEHELIIRNPWDVAVAGTLRLSSEADLQISPNVQDFAIAANGEVRLPIQIIPQRGILAGTRAINAEIDINADRLHTMRTELMVEVGLKDIEVNIAWSSSRNPLTGEDDLLVSPAVTNRSDRPVNLDIDLLAAGVSQMRRTIAALPPGQTQTRTFRIAGGAKTLAGQAVRLGVAQRDGVARLNKIVTIERTRTGDGAQLTTAEADR